MLKLVHEEPESNEVDGSGGASLSGDIVCDGARQMLAVALQAEVVTCIEDRAGELDEAGRRLVIRNGQHATREVTTAGAVSVRALRFNEKRADEAIGEPRRFSSALLPAGSRSSPRATKWQGEAAPSTARSRAGSDCVHTWDGIQLKVGLEQDKLCKLVMTGVRASSRDSAHGQRRGYGVHVCTGPPGRAINTLPSRRSNPSSRPEVISK